MKAKKLTYVAKVRIDRRRIQYAKKLGNGNLSHGIRVTIDHHQLCQSINQFQPRKAVIEKQK